MICRECSKPVEQGTRCANCPGRKRLKYVGLIFHDQRRSAVRNMRKAGVSESVAMRISGHKTAIVLRRYDIVDESDLIDASRKIELSYRQAKVAENAEIDAQEKTVQNAFVQ